MIVHTGRTSLVSKSLEHEEESERYPEAERHEADVNQDAGNEEHYGDEMEVLAHDDLLHFSAIHSSLHVHAHRNPAVFIFYRQLYLRLDTITRGARVRNRGGT